MANPAAFALVGSESLLGREVRDIAATSTPALVLRLIAAEEERPGTLTRVGDEPALVEELNQVGLTGARGIFLAGSGESSRKAIELAEAPLIDLTGAAEDRPEARVRAPMLEVEDGEFDGTTVHVIAHPAAIALGLFLRRLHAQEPIERAIVQILAPASEHGTRAVEELQTQTVSLLSFKSLPQAVFDAQLAFNLLPQYGEEAPVPLEETELRIERHLATLLDLPGEGSGAPLPSLRLIQAPVFHGYSFSAWVQFRDNLGLEALEACLAAPLIDVRSGGTEPPTNVSQAGQSGITVGALAPDRNAAEAWWFWIVADNLRLSAENAVAVARQLL